MAEPVLAKVEAAPVAASAHAPGTHQEAAQGLVDPATVLSTPYRNRLLAARTEGAHPLILDFSQAFLRDCRARGFPMFPHCYYRGKEAQEAVLKAGNSKAKWGSSPHNYGLAVDLVHFGRYWDLTQKEWAVIGLLGKEAARRRNIKIEWGGDWKFYDPAHWELKNWRDLRDWQR